MNIRIVILPLWTIILIDHHQAMLEGNDYYQHEFMRSIRDEHCIDWTGCSLDNGWSEENHQDWPSPSMPVVSPQVLWNWNAVTRRAFNCSQSTVVNGSILDGSQPKCILNTLVNPVNVGLARCFVKLVIDSSFLFANRKFIESAL